ncbi:MAG: type II toxin-antitoxin system HicB family antitoxin [Bacillota bacterium]
MKQFTFSSIVFREGATYVAYSPRLEVASCGKTINEARENLKTAVRLFIEEAEKMGTLEEILTEAGYVWKPDGQWQPPEIVSSETLVVGWA